MFRIPARLQPAWLPLTTLWVCFLALAAPLAAQNAPSWYFDKEKDYPSSRYIADMGEGITRAEAENAAAAKVALFFKTSARVRSEAVREYNDAIRNGVNEFSKRSYLNESAVISSDAEFLGIRFAPPWQDVRRGVWAALAFVDRREAAQIYSAKIGANMAAINALAQDAAQEDEALYACGLLAWAVPVCAVTEEYIKTAVVVDPAAGARYEDAIAVMQRVRSGYRAIRDGLSFSVSVRGPDTAGRIDRVLRDLLEDAGYVVGGGSGGQYTVSARLSLEEETTDSGGNFVTPGITVRVERGGKALFSYSKNYERSGSRSSMNNALQRAFTEVERDLEENFMRELTALFGR